MTKAELRKIIKEELSKIKGTPKCKYCGAEIKKVATNLKKESSTSGDAGSYNTPNAFAKNKNIKNKGTAESEALGFTVVKKHAPKTFGVKYKPTSKLIRHE